MINGAVNPYDNQTMWLFFFFLILSVYLAYEGYKIFPKYLYLRRKGLSLNAKIVGLLSIYGSKGLIPIVSYTLNGKEYDSITPVYSSFFAERDNYIGSNVLVLIDPKNHHVCVMKSDGALFMQLVITILIYIVTVYLLMDALKVPVK